MATESQRKVCAYCGESKRLTSEHIWPKSILKRTNINVRYGMKAGKTFSGDMTINDVCEECNSGPLSKLDEYGCQLFDRYFFHVPKPRKSIKFQYDYSLLMRWLLKISYNATRTTGFDTELLSKYAPVLISEFSVSPIHAVAFIGTAKAGRLKKPNSKKYDTFEPMGIRCGPAEMAGIDHYDWCSIRQVTIKGFSFTILLLRQPTVDPNVLTKLVSQIYGIRLSPDGVVRIPSPKKTTFDFYDGVQRWPRGHR
jgi:hypothetical protein